MEHIRKCNTCGQVYCYTDKDINENTLNSLMGGLSALGSLASALGGGTIFHTAELNRRTDRYNDKAIDFTKCPNCNSRNTVLIAEEDLEQLQRGGEARTGGRVEINSNATTENLLKRTEMFLQDEEWANADGYADAILDVEPENAKAYLFKLMAQLKVSHVDDLKHQKQPFDGNKNYQKAVRFGDEKLVAQLEDAIQFINNRNEEERKNSIYSRGLKKMNTAQTEEDYLKAAEEFAKIPSYPDAKKLAAQCREKAEAVRKDLIYDEAIALMAKSRLAYTNQAIEKFQTISDWRDSAKKIKACKQQISALEKKEEQIRIEQEKQSKKDSLIVTIAIVACVIFMLVGVFAMSNNQANAAAEMHQDIIGKTVFGRYKYKGSYSYSYEEEYEIYFVAKNTCNIRYEYEEGGYDGKSFAKEYPNVPYKISSDMTGVKITFESGRYDLDKGFGLSYYDEKIRLSNQELILVETD